MRTAEYFAALASCLTRVEATGSYGNPRFLETAVETCVDLLKSVQASDREVHLIGNGGSAALVAHAHNDLVKAAGLRARVHQDGPLQSAYANDCGYGVAFAKSLERLMRSSDVLIAVSSSGESVNILNAVTASRKRQAIVITLSGFEPDNSLRRMGDHNFYVPARHYGMVELTHGALLHHLTDEVSRA
jgi:D-sedoheptulose 7-phosphate isomerase